MFTPIPDHIFDMSEDDIIEYYDHPLLFFCKDLKSDRYLVAADRETPNSITWIAARIEEDYLKELLELDKTLNFLFKENKFERSSIITQIFPGGNVTVIELKDNFNLEHFAKLSHFNLSKLGG